LVRCGGAQALGQQQAKNGVLCELVDGVGGRQAGARDGDHLVDQTIGGDAGLTQAQEAFDDQCQRHNGAQHEGNDGPAGGL